MDNDLMEWRIDAINDHIKDFPLATAHDIVDRLFLEQDLNGGFSTFREQRILELHERLAILVSRIQRRPVSLPGRKRGLHG